MTNTIALGPFLGVNNRLPDTALHTENGDYLSAASNVLVGGAGKLMPIDAFTLAQSAPGAHSLHMITDTTGYLVRSGVLYAITVPTYSETLFKVLTIDDPLSYCAVGDDLFYSNGTDSGRITGGVWYPLGMPTPAKPTLSAVAGTLFAGSYQVAVSYSNSVTGEESGISPCSVASLTGDGGLRVALPAGVAGATHINVYLSPVNGSVPLLARTVATGTAFLDFTEQPTSYGRQITQRIEAPLPAGRLFEANGRLCSIKDKAVYVGLPFKRGYYEPGEGVFLFNDDVSIAVANEGGTYIAADKTYFIPGDLGNIQAMITDALPYGAVKGTAFAHPNKKAVGWFGAKGFVLADTAGQATPLMADSIAVTAPGSGSTLIIPQGPAQTVVACGWMLNLDNNTVTANTYDLGSYSRGYALKADGIYRQDSTTAQVGYACFGKVNFGTETLKHLPTVYVEIAASLSLLLTVKYIDAQGREQEYEYLARSSSDNLQMQRYDVGKGVRGTWFELTLSNPDGQRFTLASVSFAPVASQRRI